MQYFVDFVSLGSAEADNGFGGKLNSPVSRQLCQNVVKIN